MTNFKEKLINEIKSADLEIIKGIGNGSKWPMVGYYYGVVSKLLKILGKRKVDDLAPGYTALKNFTGEMKTKSMFWTTRKCKNKECENRIHEYDCKHCLDCCGGH